MSGFELPVWHGIASVPWIYPALEIVHIVGIGLLLGSLVLVELRIWGRAAELPLAPLARFGLKLTLAGFALAAASGTTMFLSQPNELLGNAPFLIKMALLMCAGLNAAVSNGPITYELDGTQYVVVAAADMVWSFAMRAN